MIKSWGKRLKGPSAIGFTGTQRGMTQLQIFKFVSVIQYQFPAIFRHGDCIGADQTAHHLVLWFLQHTSIYIHPPTNPDKRAFCDGPHPRVIIMEQKGYIPRNHDIVDGTQALIATPGEFVRQLRSGTWATVRYAESLNRPVCIIYPDGLAQYDNWP